MGYVRRLDIQKVCGSISFVTDRKVGGHFRGDQSGWNFAIIDDANHPIKPLAVWP
jgi:hypothetical protein